MRASMLNTRFGTLPWITGDPNRYHRYYQHVENAFFLFLVNSKITSISKSKNKGKHAGEKERAMAVVKYLHRTRIVLTGVCLAIEIL